MVNHTIIGNNALVTGSVVYENNDLQYLMGVGKRYSFANTEYNRLFEGNLYYTLGTPEPTSSPSQYPTSIRSLRPSLQISDIPSDFPQTKVISLSPSLIRTVTASASPSFESSSTPSVEISQFPSILASTDPSSDPTLQPTSFPSMTSDRPSSSPSNSYHPTETHLVLPFSNYNGDIMNHGNMFEIIALNDIVVRAFDIHADAGDDDLHELEIYNRPTSLGALRSPGAWNKISRDALSIACERKLAKYHVTFIFCLHYDSFVLKLISLPIAWTRIMNMICTMIYLKW